ncbi:uncharacterized protein E0L32_003761 [Thyridium curvatum]|uniref:Dipeptidase n=1 Tax=Thyridium curvatum TaxID=1093900 RepID=A0A507B9E6_9PEZI|nr:uncharacterized protein E0L32_003761 [Thyridium curvatum]TPX16467.1 hypothetical protein E0L32_003761 [Thyridium curvatum]
MAEVQPSTQSQPVDQSGPSQARPTNPAPDSQALVVQRPGQQGLRRYLYSGLVAALAVSVSLFRFGTSVFPFGASLRADDYAGRTRHVLSTTPLIDGHNDLPYVVRQELKNKIYSPRFDFAGALLSHTDLGKMRSGQMGGQFWSVYMECREEGVAQMEDATWVVRDTLEQIDVVRRLIAKHPDDLQFCVTPACVRTAFAAGKIASMIGIEGSHQLGNSLAVLRQTFELGARYLTITHNCDTPFATSATSVAAGGADGGLTPFGQRLVAEMNRLGMLVDLAHVSPQTMRDALGASAAPVIFSHSGAYALNRHLRNAPDDVLRGLRANGGVIMVPFVSFFFRTDDTGGASIHDVADQILYIADLIGWEHVGLGSDFDGSDSMVRGMEDTSKYPDLIQLLMKRGATDKQIRLLVGENILRVWTAVEKHAQRAQSTLGELPIEDVWDGREWSHVHDADLPLMFHDSKKERREAY